ncbi:unnamed protein product [Closterium sp. Yama58-4]|nr:unnamed protein product [Closterium sp. Yama58-4]
MPRFQLVPLSRLFWTAKSAAIVVFSPAAIDCPKERAWVAYSSRKNSIGCAGLLSYGLCVVYYGYIVHSCTVRNCGTNARCLKSQAGWADCVCDRGFKLLPDTSCVREFSLTHPPLLLPISAAARCVMRS